VDDPVGVDGGRVGVLVRGVVEGEAPSVANGLEEPVHEPGVQGHRLVDVDVDGLVARCLVEAVEDLVGGLPEGLAQLGDGALEGHDEGQLVFVEELEIPEDILVQLVDAGACLGDGEAALLQKGEVPLYGAGRGVELPAEGGRGHPFLLEEELQHLPHAHQALVGVLLACHLALFQTVEKRLSAALRCILRHCGVRNSTPHCSGFARLASKHF